MWRLRIGGAVPATPVRRGGRLTALDVSEFTSLQNNFTHHIRIPVENAYRAFATYYICTLTIGAHSELRADNASYRNWSPNVKFSRGFGDLRRGRQETPVQQLEDRLLVS